MNFVHYDPAKVERVYALEPNPGMLRRAEEQRGRTQLDIEFLDLPGERIPLADASVDTVMSTFTLCTIPGVVEAIRGVRRVLKPGGKFIDLGSPKNDSQFTTKLVKWADLTALDHMPRANIECCGETSHFCR